MNEAEQKRFADMYAEIERLKQEQQAKHEKQKQKQDEAQRQRIIAARRAAERQQAIDEMPRRKYAVIAAVDQHGGYSKDGKIPWHYSSDFKWFKKKTMGHVVVMGSKTYQDIVDRQTKPATDQQSEQTEVVPAQSILPGRDCFVLSRSLGFLPNAVVIKSLIEVENYLKDDEQDKVIFAIGGHHCFLEGIAMADIVYLTAINQNYQCDKFFPTEYLLEHFRRTKMYKNADDPDCRFTIWERKG